MAALLVVAAWVAFKWPAHSFTTWTPPAAQEIAASAQLDNMQRLADVDLPQPEDMLKHPKGGVLVSCGDGVIRLLTKTDGVVPWVRTGGRPLGLAWAKDGETLLVADAQRGLLQVTVDRKVTVLFDHFEGKRLKLIDDVVLAPDGQVYVSDASTHSGLHDDLRLEMASHDPTGRVFSMAPGGRVSVFASGFYFANGLAMTPDGEYLFVNETAAYRVQRCSLGANRGRCEVWIDRLPGLPDNIRISPRGTMWVALVAPRRHLLDAYIHPSITAKWAMALAPKWMLPTAELRGQVLEVAGTADRTGKPLRLLHAPGRKFGMSTSAREFEGHLWMGHIDARHGGLFKVKLPLPVTDPASASPSQP